MHAHARRRRNDGVEAYAPEGAEAQDEAATNNLCNTLFPGGTWLDSCKTARELACGTTPSATGQQAAAGRHTARLRVAKPMLEEGRKTAVTVRAVPHVDTTRRHPGSWHDTSSTDRGASFGARISIVLHGVLAMRSNRQRELVTMKVGRRNRLKHTAPSCILSHICSVLPGLHGASSPSMGDC